MSELLTRDQFREQVLRRNENKCVYCQERAVDAHHILDRALWDDGGYYLNNGVALCSPCHLLAEKTELSCEALRDWAHIEQVVQPEHFYADQKYDHWGNILLAGTAIVKGELWSGKLETLFRKSGKLQHVLPYIKYPRTYHVPWSPNLQNDDRMHESVEFFVGKDVVVTIKRDGENTSMYRDKIHARSVDSKHHESRSLIKSLHGQIAHELPEEWRICGENLYAEHSIFYRHLDSFFEVFSIWDENNQCLSWEDTKSYAEMLGLIIVPEMCSFHVKSVEMMKSILDRWWSVTCKQSSDPVEGYVVRNIESFSYKDFRRETAKFVRKGHVQTDQHWLEKPVVPNQLRII